MAAVRHLGFSKIRNFNGRSLAIGQSAADIIIIIGISIITGPPNGPVLFCSLASVVVVCRRHLSASVTQPVGGWAGRRARGRSGGLHCTAGQYGYVPLGRRLVQNGSVRHVGFVTAVFGKSSERVLCGLYSLQNYDESLP